jgi:hypothetical protein
VEEILPGWHCSIINKRVTLSITYWIIFAIWSCLMVSLFSSPAYTKTTLRIFKPLNCPIVSSVTPSLKVCLPINKQSMAVSSVDWLDFFFFFFLNFSRKINRPKWKLLLCFYCVLSRLHGSNTSTNLSIPPVILFTPCSNNTFKILGPFFLDQMLLACSFTPKR